jgi:two-component system OmpR family sensor kinase
VLAFMGSDSLRRRLTITYTATLALGLFMFALFSLMTIDQTLKNTLDARLAATARAFAATAAGHVSASTVDSATVRRLTNELGIQQNGAIVTADGGIAMQSANVPSAVAGVARHAKADAITYATVAGDGGLRVAALPIAVASGGPATILLWRPIDVIGDYERIAVTILGVASLLIIGAAFVAGSIIVARGLQPLNTMANVASEIEAHDLSRRLSNSTWAEELRTFAATFDRMLDRLQSAFQRQRQFTADASHDLRAPLSVIRAEVDLALARGRSGEMDDGTLRSIRDEVMEFDRLLEALLLAARADAGPLKSTEIDLADLAARATGRLQPFAVSRSVRIANEIKTAPVIVGDEDILERVLISLLHNGIKFSPPNGTVSLCVIDSTKTVSLIVRDEGPGFSSEALKFAFERFWKDDAARGRSGTGLGLAIAKSAVERVGGSILIRNVRAGGAEIETVFPLAVR